MQIKKVAVLAVMVAVLALMGQAQVTSAQQDIEGEVTIFHAGSLAVPFQQAEQEFEAKYPQVDVKREAAGSRTTVRKVTDLNREADIVASADYTVIKQLMMPEYTDWYANFATNEMVIMYTEHAKYGDKINKDNWYQILLKDNVSYGHSDPDADPCGYRSQLVWKLAGEYYNQPDLYNRLDEGCPPKNVRSKETDLLSLVEVGELDYIFIYRSVAKQHGFPFVELPDKINLKTSRYTDYYKQATYGISGEKPGETITKVGRPMVYGITIPHNAPNREAAVAFMEFILGEEGQQIMQENGQPPIAPATTNSVEEAPTEVESLVEQGN